MAKGSKKSYSSKQKREAAHIEDSAKASGKSTKTAERIAWATVNKQSGGGKKSGSGRKKTKKKTAKKSPSRKKSTTRSTKKKSTRKSSEN